jgi:hypothetical protein
MKRIYALAVVVSARLAFAGDPTTPDGWYEVGQTQYTLGNFDKAVEAFKKGFEMEQDDSKKPAYLYNIAQSYRQSGNCKDAVFFYKRFLAMKASDTKKPLKQALKDEVDGYIKDGEKCIEQQDSLRKQPPDHTMNPDDGHKEPDKNPDPNNTTNTTKPDNKQVGVRDDNHQPDDHIDKGVTPGAPKHVLSASLVGGASKVSAGSLDIPLNATGTLVAGYPLAINDKLGVEVGAAFGFTPVGYQNTITTQSKTASLTAVMANAGAAYVVAPKLAVRGDVGVGVLLFSGIDEMGSPFTQGGAGTSGALTMLHVRAAVSGTYELTPNICATITPFAFGYSPPKDGLRDDIKAITSIDFMIGVGYRM